METSQPWKEIPMWTEVGKARAYSGASEKRRRIDSLAIGETFTIGCLSLRVENFVFAKGKKKRRASSYDPTSPPERPRNYPHFADILRIAGRKIEKGEKSGGDRGQDRDRRLVQAELL